MKSSNIPRNGMYIDQYLPPQIGQIIGIKRDNKTLQGLVVELLSDYRFKVITEELMIDTAEWKPPREHK